MNEVFRLYLQKESDIQPNLYCHDMKHLFSVFLSLLLVSALFSTAHSIVADNEDKNVQWIQSRLKESGESIKCKNYIFYGTTGYMVTWSLITLDSSEIHIYRGSTSRRPFLDSNICNTIDTPAIIRDNIKTIIWGFDSLPNASKSLTPIVDTTYNPFFRFIDIVKDNRTVFNSNSRTSYVGPDSENFNEKFRKLYYLMFWLRNPQIQRSFPTPADTLKDF